MINQNKTPKQSLEGTKSAHTPEELSLRIGINLGFLKFDAKGQKLAPATVAYLMVLSTVTSLIGLFGYGIYQILIR